MYNTLSASVKSRFFRVREWVRSNTGSFVFLAQLALVAAIFFGLGIIYAQNFIKEPPPVTITEPTESHSSVSVPAAVVEKPMARNFVASKNGKAYYLSTCANNINEENKIYFRTKEEAEKAGFQPAKTCFK